MEVIKQLLSNEDFIGCAMAVIIFGLTFLIKFPIKKWTNTFSNQRKRDIVNGIFVLIPIALGLLGQFLYNYFYLHTATVNIMGFGFGGGAIAIYDFLEKLFKKKGIPLDNPFNSEEGEAVKKLIEEVQDDGKVDKSDISAVDEFWKTISKDKTETKK